MKQSTNTDFSLPENQSIIFSLDKSLVPLLKLDPAGMTYKGIKIDDAGKAHTAWIETMAALQNQWQLARRGWMIAFASPWDNGIQVKLIKGNHDWKSAFKEAFPGFYEMIKDLNPDISIAIKQAEKGHGEFEDHPFEFNVVEVDLF